jgi:hypothetical protein
MYKRTSTRIIISGVLSLLLSTDVSASFHHQCISTTPPLVLPKQFWGIKSGKSQLARVHVDLRGGATEPEDDYDEYDDDYDDESEDDFVADDRELNATDESDGVQIEMKVEKFDDPLVPSPMISLGASLGVMLLAKRVDLFHPTTVRIARAVFVAYLICLQAFVLYARRKAKTYNNRSPLTMSSPLSAVLNAQLGEQSGMVKNLASSLLSSESTVMEYDLKQAKSMQSGLLFNMLFMWFLHFKMNQVQPLIIQTITGFSNLIYSPLFQVYVMGKNLERPFKNPAMRQLDAPSSSDDLSVNDDSCKASLEKQPIEAKEVPADDGDDDAVEEDDQDESPDKPEEVTSTVSAESDSSDDDSSDDEEEET